jgi:hypothetical protein
MQEALVFIVRLWGAVEPQASFRATVLHAGSDESTWFTQSEALARYFEKQVRALASTRDRAEREEQS